MSSHTRAVYRRNYKYARPQKQVPIVQCTLHADEATRSIATERPEAVALADRTEGATVGAIDGVLELLEGGAEPFAAVHDVHEAERVEVLEAVRGAVGERARRRRLVLPREDEVEIPIVDLQ